MLVFGCISSFLSFARAEGARDEVHLNFHGRMTSSLLIRGFCKQSSNPSAHSTAAADEKMFAPRPHSTAQEEKNDKTLSSSSRYDTSLLVIPTFI